MTVETISGHCPCCGYDKMLMRYGSSGWTHWEGCPNCGFGYCDFRGSLEEDIPMDNEIGSPHWMEWEEHLVAKKGEQLSEMELRRRLFEFTENNERHNDVENTLFEYSPQVIKAYKATNPIIFKPIS